MIISFTNKNESRVALPHGDALVVTLAVVNYAIHRISIDNGSSTDILYWPAFDKMKIDRKRINSVSFPLVGFAGERVRLVGATTLQVIAGIAPKSQR